MKPFVTSIALTGVITLAGAASLLVGYGARAQDAMEMPGNMDHGHQMEMMEGGQAHAIDHDAMGHDEGMEQHQAAPSDGREFIVRMKFDDETGDLYFAPARLEIAPGDTVTWIQDDDINEHNVAAYPDRIPKGSEPFEGPMLTEKGQSWSATFGVPGSYYYHCHPHEAVMRGLIVVGRESH
jgi:plastocyanin